MSGAELMLVAWVAESLFGYPAWLYRRIRHPVVWMGALIGSLDRASNRPGAGHAGRYFLGIAATLVTVALATGAALAISTLLPTSPSGSPPGLMLLGWLVAAAIASSLIASRSLYSHVAAVADALATDDLAGARNALSHIVGRDTAELSTAAVAGAALESLAENTSDGVIAPIFWGVLLGLPGLAAYKAINTLDSMIGHRSLFRYVEVDDARGVWQTLAAGGVYVRRFPWTDRHLRIGLPKDAEAEARLLEALGK